MLKTGRTVEFVTEARKRGMTEQEFALYRATLRNRLAKRKARK